MLRVALRRLGLYVLRRLVRSVWLSRIPLVRHGRTVAGAFVDLRHVPRPGDTGPGDYWDRSRGCRPAAAVQRVAECLALLSQAGTLPQAAPQRLRCAIRLPVSGAESVPVVVLNRVPVLHAAIPTPVQVHRGMYRFGAAVQCLGHRADHRVQLSACGSVIKGVSKEAGLVLGESGRADPLRDRGRVEQPHSPHRVEPVHGDLGTGPAVIIGGVTGAVPR